MNDQHTQENWQDQERDGAASQSPATQVPQQDASENEPTAEPSQKKRKWKPFVFEEPLPALEPFDLHPVTDIVVRNAVEDGVKNKRGLSLYKTTGEWNGYLPGTVVITAEVASGQPGAVWDPPKRKAAKETSTKQAHDESMDDAMDQNGKATEQTES